MRRVQFCRWSSASDAVAETLSARCRPSAHLASYAGRGVPGVDSGYVRTERSTGGPNRSSSATRLLGRVERRTVEDGRSNFESSATACAFDHRISSGGGGRGSVLRHRALARRRRGPRSSSLSSSERGSRTRTTAGTRRAERSTNTGVTTNRATSAAIVASYPARDGARDDVRDTRHDAVLCQPAAPHLARVRPWNSRRLEQRAHGTACAE
jgi:hypothetical protein